MAFVPVPKTKVLFCIWETRVQDFEAFVKDQANNGGYNYQKGNEPHILKSDGWKQRGWDYGWNNPGFVQRATHPVTCVSWQDTQAFCQWLTQKEQRGGKLQKDQSYRLPTDAEWSMAVGLNEPDGGTIRDKDGKSENVYPWGKQWPPLDRAGNFAGEESMDGDNPPGYWIMIPGYRDGFTRTAPVGSFKANELGIFDLSGNVWEWCVDWYEDEDSVRVLRGGSCYDGAPKSLLSSSRFGHKPNLRGNNFGFRVVLVAGSAP
jgi:formylglycine-generating enzyme required for sulfatase activity